MGIKVATLMMELRDQKCQAHFGEDVWALASSKTKAIFNFLCGNHTRNLPIVRYNKVHSLLYFYCTVQMYLKSTVQIYNKWLHTQLGEQMRLAKAACGELEFHEYSLSTTGTKRSVLMSA